MNTAGLTSSSGHLIAGAHSGIELVGGSLGGADAANYTFAGATGNYTVTPLALTGSIGAGSSAYGSALAPGAASLTNAVAGDVLGTATVGVNTAGLTSSSGNLKAGTHTGIETVSALSGADGGNYTFAGVTGNYTVTPLALSGSIGAGSSTYGSALAPGAASLTGAIAGDVLGTATIAVNTTGLTSSSGHLIAGTHAGIETVSALGGADGGNYTFAGVTGNYTVTPLALSASLATGSSTYGSALAPGAVTFTNLVTGDAVTAAAVTVNTAGLTSSSGHLIAGAHAGIELVGGSLGGADAANYTFAGATGNYTVNALSITLSGTQTYNGQTAAASSGLTVTNAIAGDTVGLAGTGVLASKNAGPEALTSVAGALAGLSVSNSNYTVIGGSGSVMVTPASITVTALGGTSVYGSSPTNPGLAATGLQNGENVGVLTGLSNSFGITSTSSVAGSPYPLSVVGVLSNPNYTVTARIAGSWTVTPAPSVGSGLATSRVVFDSFDMLALPDYAKLVFAAVGIRTGVIYSDPHFDKVFVCFGGGGGTAQSCTAAGNGVH